MIATSKSLLDTVPGNASCAAPATHNAARCGPGEPVVTGIGLAATERIMFVGLTSLSENATFCNARKATEAAASALFGAASQQRAFDDGRLGRGRRTHGLLDH